MDSNNIYTVLFSLHGYDSLGTPIRKIIGCSF